LTAAGPCKWHIFYGFRSSKKKSSRNFSSSTISKYTKMQIVEDERGSEVSAPELILMNQVGEVRSVWQAGGAALSIQSSSKDHL
jgi:hypothetical protein